MNALGLLALAVVAAPVVTAGPDLADRATALEAPIAEVTVYSDRARIRRRGRHNAGPGVHALQLPDLPGAVLLDTVRLSCKGGRVLRIEVTPVERERTSIDQVVELIEKLEQLRDRDALFVAEESVHREELGLLQSLSPTGPVDEKDRVGRPPLPLRPELYSKVMDFAQRRGAAANAKLFGLALQRRELAREYDRLKREVQRRNLGAFTDRKVQVLALVQSRQAGTLDLELEYFMTGASWRPAYELHYDPAGGKLRLLTAGRVQQATGEEWEAVQMLLSTAIPGQGIEVPELLTWALGEKKEFIPTVRAARMPPVPPRFPPPQPQQTLRAAERAASAELVRQRINELQSLAGLSLDGLAGPQRGDLASVSGVGGLGLRGSGAGGGGVGYGRGVGAVAAAPASPSPRRSRRSSAKESRPRPSPPPAMSRSMVMADAAPMPMEEMADEDEGYYRGSPPPAPGGSSSVPTTSLKLFEPERHRGHRITDSSLPAVLAGGLDYVYRSPSPATIPSTGDQLSVPLSSEVHPAQVQYLATPALKKTAYLQAEVTNRTATPILAGPVNIFIGKDFTGEGKLRTTGPGGLLTLPLGADEDIRLKRTVVPSSETEGMFRKEDVTTYTTTIEVGNYKKRDVHIAILDVYPQAPHEKIKVERVRVSPEPTKGPDEEGIVRWELDLRAGATARIEMVYRIKRPANWQLHQ